MVETKKAPSERSGGAGENAVVELNDQWRNATGPPQQE